MENIDNKFRQSDNIIGYRQLENIQPTKSIKLTAFIKTEKTSVDSLGIYIGYSGIETDSVIRLKDFSLIGTNDWKEYSVDLPAEPNQDFYNIGVALFGEGKIWIDDIKLYVDDKQIYTIPPAPNFRANKRELNWLKINSIPLKGEQAESGFEDLEPLKKLIGDARIVGLGEFSHGSSEVFKMKHRLVEFLASEMGFTIFSIEGNMPEAYRLNDYVLHGIGDPETLLKGMNFWIWNTQEVLDMIWWMRKYNTRGGIPIQFTGFDMQNHLVALENLQNFAEKYDRTFRSKVDTLSVLLDQLRIEGPRTNEIKDKIALIKLKCAEVLTYMVTNSEKISKSFSESEYKWLIQNANILNQRFELAERAYEGFSYRDESMTKNISWILDNNPDAKIVLWAHNTHIMKYSGMMGGFLSKKYGDEYYNIGFLSNRGTYTAKNSTMISSNNILTEGKPGSFEYSFYKSGIPIFYFDFKQVNKNEPESKWLTNKLNFRNIGALTMENQFIPANISKLFNAIIYIDSTKASNCFNVTK
jgi:erythromycin esterase